MKVKFGKFIKLDGCEMQQALKIKDGKVVETGPIYIAEELANAVLSENAIGNQSSIIQQMEFAQRLYNAREELEIEISDSEKKRIEELALSGKFNIHKSYQILQCIK